MVESRPWNKCMTCNKQPLRTKHKFHFTRYHQIIAKLHWQKDAHIHMYFRQGKSGVQTKGTPKNINVIHNFTKSLHHHRQHRHHLQLSVELASPCPFWVSSLLPPSSWSTSSIVVVVIIVPRSDQRDSCWNFANVNIITIIISSSTSSSRTIPMFLLNWVVVVHVRDNDRDEVDVAIGIGCNVAVHTKKDNSTYTLAHLWARQRDTTLHITQIHLHTHTGIYFVAFANA